MDLASLVMLVLQISIVLTVIALGLEAKFEDVFSIVRRPAQLLRSLFAMNVVMPVVAVALATAFDLHPAVRIALVALSLSPIPPLLPKKQLKAGGTSYYAFGLLVTAGLIAIIFIPLALQGVEQIAGVSLQLSPGRIARLVLVTILVPLGVGLAINRFAPVFAARIARPLALVATVLLSAGAAVVLVNAWPTMVSLIGNGTLAAFAAFVVVGLAAGHLLGGPDPRDRTVLALATATRHPGIALAIATTNFPDQKLVLPAVLLYMLAGIILSIPYMKWRPA